MQFPHFFIVGAPKCGTTTLYTWLGGHPAINAPHKEPCFFSQDIFPTASLDTHISDLDEYRRIFSLKDQQVISGEATPKYLFSDQAIEEISALQPGARVIVCLRDPVELVLSLYNQKLREGVEHRPTFEEAWTASLAAVDGTGVALPHERNYFLWGCLGSRLRKLHAHFEPGSILILLTSELRNNPRGCYLRTLEFLGVPDDGRTEFPVRNERVAIRSLKVHRGVRRVKRLARPVLRPLYRVRGGRGLGVLKLVNRFNTQPGEYTSSVPEAFRYEMYRLLRDEVALAESYLRGRQLVGRSIEG